MNKLRYDDSPKECVIKLCDGNPGAINVLMLLLQADPVLGYVDLHHLDDAEIYGSDIWVAYKNVHGGDLGALQESIREGTLKSLLEKAREVRP